MLTILMTKCMEKACIQSLMYNYILFFVSFQVNVDDWTTLLVNLESSFPNNHSVSISFNVF